MPTEKGGDDLEALFFEGVGEFGNRSEHIAEHVPLFFGINLNHRVIEFFLTNIRQIIDKCKRNLHYLNISGFLVLTNSSENSPSHHTTCSTLFGDTTTLRLMS